VEVRRHAIAALAEDLSNLESRDAVLSRLHDSERDVQSEAISAAARLVEERSVADDRTLLQADVLDVSRMLGKAAKRVMGASRSSKIARSYVVRDRWAGAEAIQTFERMLFRYELPDHARH